MEEIFEAAAQGNEVEVISLLEADLTLLEKEDRNGQPLLVRAAGAGQLGVIKLLVQRGVNIDNKASVGSRTALHVAALSGHEAVVGYLVSTGAQVDIADASGMTPVALAADKGHLGVVRVFAQQVEAQRLTVRTWGRHAVTVLHWAAGRGHEDVVATLLGKGAKADMEGIGRQTPLMHACMRGHVGVGRLLLEHMAGGGLMDRDRQRRTALWFAARGGHEEMVRFLLDNGARAGSMDTEYRSTPFIQACMRGHVGVMRLLLRHRGGKGLEDRDFDRRTALWHAAQGGHEEMVRFLLDNGAQARTIDNYGRTPFMEACQNGHLDVMRLLLRRKGRRGSALHQRDTEGRTALHHAAVNGRAKIVSVLLVVGADPTIMDNDGSSPRADAQRRERADCMAVFDWWDCEPKFHYLLQRARCIQDTHTTRRDKPAAPVPAFLQARVAAGQALPEVEVMGRQQEEQQAGASGKREASTEEGSVHQEEERHEMLAYVVAQLNEQLYIELMQGFSTEGRR